MSDKTISEARGGISPPLAVSLQNINKTFGSVQANKDVCLSVTPASIHGIVGENGAGKSTLVSVLILQQEAFLQERLRQIGLKS